MAGETRADWAWTQRHRGFYVVNKVSRLAVAGPFDTAEGAFGEKAERDQRWPNAGNDLGVFEVMRGRSTYVTEISHAF